MPKVVLELFSALVLIVLIVCQLSDKDRSERLSRIFLLVLFLHTAMLLLDAAVWIADWLPGESVDTFARAANFMVYSLGIIDVAAFIAYVSESIPLETRAKKKLVWFVSIVVAAFHVLLIISQFNGMIYSIGPANQFEMGPMFLLPHLFGGILFLTIIIVVLQNRKKLGVRNTVTFMTYVLIPALALIINAVVYYLMLAYAAMALALLVIFVNIQMRRARQLKEKELELMESKVAVMLSQIQPHFLYNALYSISKLCDIDAKIAKEAVIDFGQYLRGNLDSLTRQAAIPFEHELRHVQTYLSLEKKRFEERLDVVYDIGAVDFELPALTLQPIVENAVRYGAAKLKQGGTVTIRSYETDEDWLVVVEDNGNGFDPGGIPRDGRSHVGIENAANRLKLMCNGSIRVDSGPGRGTAVTINIPKGGGGP